MIRFSRSYERSVLIYQETGPRGRLLLRLGRTYEDGECRPDRDDIPESCELLTYIVSRNAKALIADLAESFSEYLEDTSDMRFNSLLLNTPALQRRLADEMEAPEGSSLLDRVEAAYGRHVLETLYAATFGRDGKPGKLPAAKRTQKPDMQRRLYWSGGFIMIVAIPIAATLLFRADPYTNTSEVFRQSAIVNYASSDRNVSVVASEPPPDNTARVLEEARARKQDLFIAGEFGLIREDGTVARTVSEGEDEVAFLPDWMARFTIEAVRRFAADAGDGTAAEDVSATYRLTRKPLTIFEVTSYDLEGLPTALDIAMAATCREMAERPDLRSVSLSFEMGSSPFAAISLAERDCMAGRYEIMPLFDMVPDTETP